LERYAATSQEQFDVVLSLGFIEHFNNFCDVIYDHARLCKEGGLVIIGAPNFASPIQRALHRALDEKNLADHVLEAMYPKTWATFLACLGFQIDYAGSIGGFDFWHETPADNPSITVMQNLIPHLSSFAQKLADGFNASESSYLAVVGKRTGALPPKEEAERMAALCHEIASDLSSKDDALSEDGFRFLSGLCK
jgi:SAM-dependent methyltransferase